MDNDHTDLEDIRKKELKWDDKSRSFRLGRHWDVVRDPDTKEVLIAYAYPEVINGIVPCVKVGVRMTTKQWDELTSQL